MGTMHTLFDCKTDITNYQLLARQLNEEIVAKLQPLEQHVVIPAHASVTPRWAARPAFFVIEEGCLRVSSPEGAMLVYEEGDIVGLNSSELYPLSIETPEFASVVSVYSCDTFQHEALTSPAKIALWNEYLCASSMLFLALLAERVHLAKDPTPAIRVFRDGDVILTQGKPGSSVLTMVEGHARVVVDGVEVGEVHKDEIFGAIAAMTGTERNATVIATTECLVMELDAGQFQALLQTHPALVTRLVQDMARTIQSLNSNLVGRIAQTAQQL